MPHTPGPYHADHSGERIAIWALGNKRVFLGACSEKEIGRREAEANAALFVAAPDLLAACESIAEAYEAHDWSDSGVSNALYDAMERMRTAITKARGA